MLLQMLRPRPFKATYTLSSLCRRTRSVSHNNNVQRPPPLRQPSPASQHQQHQQQQNAIPPYIWIFVGGCTTAMGMTYYAYLDVVPITGRKRWIVTSPNWERQMGDQEYRHLMKQFRADILPSTHRASVTVQRVGQRIATASISFAQQHNFIPASNNNKTTTPLYTFTVVRSDMANAFVLPGNHVFVFTGLFRYVQNEDELAIILGHEMAHNLARHVGEKMSSSLVLGILARLSLLFDSSGTIMTLLLPTMSLIRELPNSRTLEIEADHIGILLAAEACFDPRAATNVFAALQDGESRHAQPPEFLSTHPSHHTRLEKFDEWTPVALERYHASDRCRSVREQMKRARVQAAVTAAQRGL